MGAWKWSLFWCRSFGSNTLVIGVINNSCPFQFQRRKQSMPTFHQWSDLTLCMNYLQEECPTKLLKTSIPVYLKHCTHSNISCTALWCSKKIISAISQCCLPKHASRAKQAIFGICCTIKFKIIFHSVLALYIMGWNKITNYYLDLDNYCWHALLATNEGTN
jgi:hypothetical protein